MMGKRYGWTSLWAVLALCLGLWLLPAPAAQAQTPDGQAAPLPGAESWQPYLDESPVTLEEFAASPLEALRSFLPEDLPKTLRQELRNYVDVFLFLLLVLLVSFLTGESGEDGLLELIAAGGCSLLVWSRMLDMAQLLCGKLESWRSFLLGFIPVYAGVLAAGGETAAAASAGSFFLAALCVLAQALCAWTQPLLQCYLALSAACCISTEKGLASACQTAGRLLRQGLAFAGKAFAALLGIQRIFTASADRTALRAGQLLTGTVPIVGQTLSGAVETVLSGMQLLKSGLGFAAVAVLAVEFVPLYIYLLVHVLLLTGCGLFCSVTGIRRCEALFACLREAVQAMAAAAALFFGLTALGTALMMAVGGG